MYTNISCLFAFAVRMDERQICFTETDGYGECACKVCACAQIFLPWEILFPITMKYEHALDKTAVTVLQCI